MNSIPGRETENWTLSFNQPKETHKKGLLLGTDFRHAVEFSRSGRAATRPSRASSLAACPTVRRLRSRAPGGALRGPPGPVRRVENHTRPPGTVRKPGRRVPRHRWPRAAPSVGLAERARSGRGGVLLPGLCRVGKPAAPLQVPLRASGGGGSGVLV